MRKKLYTPAVKSHVVVLNEANNGHHLQLTGTTNITKRDDAMDAYLKDISKYTILTSDEEAELVQKA